MPDCNHLEASPRRLLSLVVITMLVAGGCTPPAAMDGESTPARPAAEAPAAPAVEATVTKTEPADAPPSDPGIGGFAAAPQVGQVIRANCKMGGCWWYRFESVQVDERMPPRYRLQVRVGDSGPHPDPYPLQAEGVAIRWDAEPQAATEVDCSKDAPLVRFGDRQHRLALGPDGVSGPEQGVANLYFATCHGEWGDDAALARQYGYDVR